MKGLPIALPLFSALVVAACGDLPPAPLTVASSAATMERAADDGYVDLPAGRYHRSCVYQVGNDDRVDRSGWVTRADGSKFKMLPCRYPTLDSRLRRRGLDANPPSYHSASWREAIEGQVIAVRTIHRLTAQWTVPPNAAYDGTSTYYSFPGIENPDPGGPDSSVFILQPVIGYSHGTWYMTSVRCNNGSNCVSSPHITVQPGDLITGVVDTPFGCSLFCEFWVVTKNERTGEMTRLIVTNELDNYVRYIGAAVETYGLTSCNMYPEGGINYSSIQVWDNVGQVTPFWNTYYGDISLGCNFGVQYTTGLVSTASLKHGMPMTVYIDGPTMLPDGYSGSWSATVSGAATPPYTYQWTGFASGSSQSITATPPYPGDWLYLNVWDSAGHSAQASVFVTVCPPPQFSC